MTNAYASKVSIFIVFVDRQVVLRNGFSGWLTKTPCLRSFTKARTEGHRCFWFMQAISVSAGVSRKYLSYGLGADEIWQLKVFVTYLIEAVVTFAHTACLGFEITLWVLLSFLRALLM